MADEAIISFLIFAQSFSVFAMRSVFPLRLSRVMVVFMFFMFRAVTSMVSAFSGSIVSFILASKYGCMSLSYSLFSLGMFLHAAHRFVAAFMKSAFWAGVTSVHLFRQSYFFSAASPHSGRSA